MGTKRPVPLRQPMGMCPGDKAKSPGLGDRETPGHPHPEAETEKPGATMRQDLLLHEAKTEMQTRNFERNLRPEPETPRVPGRRPRTLGPAGLWPRPWIDKELHAACKEPAAHRVLWGSCGSQGTQPAPQPSVAPTESRPTPLPPHIHAGCSPGLPQAASGLWASLPFGSKPSGRLLSW